MSYTLDNSVHTVWSITRKQGDIKSGFSEGLILCVYKKSKVLLVMVTSVTEGGLENLFRGFRGRRSMTMEISDGLSWFFNRQWGLDRVKLNDFGRRGTTYPPHTVYTWLIEPNADYFESKMYRFFPIFTHFKLHPRFTRIPLVKVLSTR